MPLNGLCMMCAVLCLYVGLPLLQSTLGTQAYERRTSESSVVKLFHPSHVDFIETMKEHGSEI